MEGSGQRTQPPPLIGFGPPGGWRAAGIAGISAVLTAFITALLTARWLRPAVADALEWAVGIATMLVVYRRLSVRAWRPQWPVVFVAWIGLVVLAFVIRLLLAGFLAQAG